MRIDHQFDTAFANEIALLESYNKHFYRPNSYLHKWWARRCGTTFRAILKHLVTDEARQDFYAPGGLEGKIILDPMLGGGTTIHEAIRLGANVIGVDIDPIPILQARATLADVALADLQAAFNQFFHRLHADLGHLYQTSCPWCGVVCPWQFMLHGRRQRCACREVVVVDSLLLRHNNNDSTFRLDPAARAVMHNDYPLVVLEASLPPLVEKGDKLCTNCGQPYQDLFDLPYHQRYTPLAAAGECPQHGLFFTAVGPHERHAFAAAEVQRNDLSFTPADFAITPGPKSQSLLDRQIASYLDLFSGRQLLFLQQAVALLQEVEPLVRLNLALLVSTSLEFNSLLCGYKGARKRRPGAIRHTFAHHAYSFPYTAAENNPLYPKRASGNLHNLFYNRIKQARRWAAAPEERRIVNGQAHKVVIQGERDGGREVTDPASLTSGERRFLLMQGSSAALKLASGSVDFVITDPPYFDSVQYSDLAAFFRVWLRQLVPEAGDWQYALEEAAVDQQTNGNGQYDRVLGNIFAECARVLKPDGRFIFTFHHWNPKGWAAVTKGLQRAGFVLVNRYVVHAENQVSVHIAGQKALLHDVILVLARAASGLQPAWPRPETIDLHDSEAFGQGCGAALGWLLEEGMTDAAVDAYWAALLVEKG